MRPCRELNLTLVVALRLRLISIVTVVAGWFVIGPDVDRLGREMRSAWISFARTGVPTVDAGGGGGSGDSVDWEPYNESARPTMIFASAHESTMADDPLGAERKAMAEAKGA